MDAETKITMGSSEGDNSPILKEDSPPKVNPQEEDKSPGALGGDSPSNPFSSALEAEEAENKQLANDDYTIQCPAYVAQEEVEVHKHAFKEAGVDAKAAQKVIDQLVRYGQEREKKSAQELSQTLEEDKRILQKEFGSDYTTRERDIARYFRRENIPDADVQDFISTWGFQKTFKFFDRYAQLNKESLAGDTFAREEGRSSSSAAVSADNFSDPEFMKKIDAGDPEAMGKMRAWALRQAQQE